MKVGVPCVKVGSDDFTNLPLLRQYARTGLPLILSSGMSDLAEAHQALEVVGALEGHPTVLLVGTSQYPTQPRDANLSRITTLRAAFPMVPIGFSDHTRGPLASAIAVVLAPACSRSISRSTMTYPVQITGFRRIPRGCPPGSARFARRASCWEVRLLGRHRSSVATSWNSAAVGGRPRHSSGRGHRGAGVDTKTRSGWTRHASRPRVLPGRQTCAAHLGRGRAH